MVKNNNIIIYISCTLKKRQISTGMDQNQHDDDQHDDDQRGSIGRIRKRSEKVIFSNIHLIAMKIYI